MDSDDDDQIIHHHTYGTVMLDVNRCAGRLEHVVQNDDNDYDADGNVLPNELQVRLAKLIVKLLMRKPHLHYYQGFHDVCLTCLLIMGDKEALRCLDKLIDTHLYMYMQPTLRETQDMLALIPIIIRQESETLANFLEEAQIGTIYALSWVITWFSHVLPRQADVEKLFRFFSARDRKLVLYVCASIVLYKEEDIIQLDCEMSTVHHFLTQVPRKEKLPLDTLTTKALELFEKHPPESMELLLEKRLREEARRKRIQRFKSKVTKMSEPITDLVRSSPKTAIIVLVLVSAFAMQYEGWRKWMF